MKPAQIAVCFGVAGAIVALLDNTLGSGTQAALVLGLAYFLAIAHGCVAIVAAAELAKGKWVAGVKQYLFAVIPFILFGSVMVLALIPKFHDLYSGAEHGLPTMYSTGAFFARAVIFLGLSFVLAWKYSQVSMSGEGNRDLWGVLYVFVFVITQSHIGFEWIMSLAYPWMSTLLGAYFFVEALYMSLVTGAMISFFLHRKAKAEGREVSKAVAKSQYDIGVVMLGFSVLWAYFFFAHLIVIWYGNLPGERELFTVRDQAPYMQLGLVIFFCNFIIPFITMQFQKSKRNPWVTSGVGLVVASGLVMERIWFIHPLVDINWICLAVYFVVFTILFVLLVRGEMVKGDVFVKKANHVKDDDEKKDNEKKEAA